MRHSSPVVTGYVETGSVSMKSRFLRMFLVLPLLASAQPPAPQAPPKGVQSQVQASTGVATFSATAQLVLEQVNVKDKDGKPIEGLKKEDFTITEDNKPQVIKIFDYEKLEEVAAEAPVMQTEHKPEPVALPKLTRTQIAPEPTGTVMYKNRRLLALYFDMSSMQILDQLHALDAANQFIKKQMSNAD